MSKTSKRSFRPYLETLELRQMLCGDVGSVSDLSDWLGVENQTSPNDYAVLAPTAAGGTFDARRTPAAGEAPAYLADTSLDVPSGVLDTSTPGGFGATGTLTFQASSDHTTLADPVFLFGFFDSNDLAAGAFGLSPADSSTTAFRFRASAGLAQTTGSGTVIPEGTYTFTIDVNNAVSGANTVRVRFVDASSATVLDVSVAIPAGSPLQANAFGFLQPPATGADSDAMFDLTIRDVSYTGGTPVDGTGAPAAPTDLTATAAGSDTQAQLTWTDNSDNETGFKVERKTGTIGPWAEVADVAADTTAYTDTGLNTSTTYSYRVRAYNDDACSDYSNEATATTAGTIPVHISAEQFSRTQIYHSPQTPGWTSWVGAWIMPDGSLMVSFTQATGPIPDDNYNYDFSGLDIDVVYLRSWDGGASWTQVAVSDVNFTTPEDSGLGTAANNGGTTLALQDGSIIRRVYGYDYNQFPNMPGTAFFQLSTDGGQTWSDPPTSTDGGLTWSNPAPIQEFLLDPAQYTVQPTRMRRLRDGRIVVEGNVWNAPHTQRGQPEPLLMVSSDEGVSWQRVNFKGPNYDPSWDSKWDEWDFAELDNGDLFVVTRPSDSQGRWQGIMTKEGDSWELTTFGPSVLPHSGHPDLLKTQEGPVLHIATTGTDWTNDGGQTWNHLDVDSLPNGYSSLYYPRSLQTADGWVYVFSHRGADNYYGQVDQAIFMDKFRLVVDGKGRIGLRQPPSTQSLTPAQEPGTIAAGMAHALMFRGGGDAGVNDAVQGSPAALDFGGPLTRPLSKAEGEFLPQPSPEIRGSRSATAGRVVRRGYPGETGPYRKTVEIGFELDPVLDEAGPESDHGSLPVAQDF